MRYEKHEILTEMIRRGLVQNTYRAKSLNKMSDEWLLKEWEKHCSHDGATQAKK